MDTDRTVVAFYKFIKKHASIPFKLQKPAAPPTTPLSPDEKPAAEKITGDSPTSDVKDEL